MQADRVFKEFRGRFIGKCSPVHFFWGAPDLAVTRFSGRRAQNIPVGFQTCRLDNSGRHTHRKSVAAGSGPAGVRYPTPRFLYAYPEPAGFAAASVQPGTAFYRSELREFILPYNIVRQ